MEVLQEIIADLRKSQIFQWIQDIATLIMLVFILYIVWVFASALVPQPNFY